MMLPKAADAVTVMESDVNVKTPDARQIAISRIRPAAQLRAC
ncbi:MAG TPA: hypothetical protein VHY84_22305 [Bryobacteraceae bacterium]|jgi:hypothetical protein|nr:hypothetical protein [Bryobacteraceae bacterium]